MTTHKIFAILLIAGMITTSIAASSTIPFQLAGKLIIVKATVDGQPGNFILDTGVSKLVLNDRYFEGEPTDKVFTALMVRLEIWRSAIRRSRSADSTGKRSMPKSFP